MEIAENFIKIAGIVLSVATLFSTYRQYKSKIQIEIFEKYTKRYNEIITPENMANWNFAINGDKTLWEHMTPEMIKYLNLVWEEYYLSQSGIIPEDLWSIWRPEINRVLKSDFAKAIIRQYGFQLPQIV